MTNLTLLSLDRYESLKCSQQDILDQIKHVEKKTPRNEVFDFDLELRKRNTELIAIVDGD